jgi:ribosomal protein S18 acetylase RimI-like enzyme
MLKGVRDVQNALARGRRVKHVCRAMNSLTIDIRPAAAKDADQIADVHASAWEKTYQGLIPHKSLRTMIDRRHGNWWERAIRRGTSVMVVDMGGMVAGYCTFGLNRARALPQEGEIYELYIRPEYQGIGIGTRLFAAARASLSNHGCKGLVVWAIEENGMATSFYHGQGGKDVAQGFETFQDKKLRKVAFVWQ